MKKSNFRIIGYLLLVAILISCKKQYNNETKSFFKSSENLKRYKNEVFTNTAIKVTKDIVYRGIYDYASGDNIKQTLKLNFYEPINDTVNKRPVIIYIHGGGLQGGSKDDISGDSLCRTFTKHGFVVASINYRLDPTLSKKKCDGTLNAIIQFQALYRATQDARFAIRFIKSVANIGKIDTNKVFIGGGSAGGAIALHATYLDDNEVPQSYINQTFFGKLNYGGINLSSKVKAVFAISGGLTDVNFIQTGNVPAACTHSIGDNLIPIDYGLEVFELVNIYGGRGVYKRLKQLNIVDSTCFKPNLLDTIVGRPYYYIAGRSYCLPIDSLNKKPLRFWTHGSGSNNTKSDIQFFCDFMYKLL